MVQQQIMSLQTMFLAFNEEDGKVYTVCSETPMMAGKKIFHFQSV